MLFSACFVLAVFTATPPLSAASPPPYEAAVFRAEESWLARRKHLDQTMVEGLVDFADWCRLKGMHATRIELLQKVLALAPGNEDALKGLGHKHQRDGSWKAPSKEPAGKDRTKSVLVRQVAERLEALVRPYCDGMQGVLEREPELPQVKRDELIARILSQDSTHAWAHRERGEGLLGERWVLLETLTGKTRRRQVSESCFDAWRAAADVRSADIFDDETSWGVNFQHSVGTRDVRVLTSGERSEAEQVARMVHASRVFFADLFDAPDAVLPEDLTVYLLVHGGKERDRFLRTYPGLASGQREFLSTLIGTGIPGSNDAVQWSEDPLQRLDVSVRHAFSKLLASTYGITPKDGWIWEGFGIYLTRHLIGTRLVWYVRPTEYLLDDGVKLAEKMLESTANWMQAGYSMLKSKRAPKLAFVMGRDMNSMGTEDLLAAYVLAAFLLEGHPEELGKLLMRIGNGEGSVPAFEAEIGIALPLLRDRLLLWLEERV